MEAFRRMVDWVTGLFRPRRYPVQPWTPPVQIEVEEPEPRQAPQFRDPREQLDVQEWLEATQSQSEERMEIVDVRRDVRMTRQVRRLTPDGLIIEEREALLQTTHGQIIHRDELFGGGQCCVCGGYADREHFYLCQACGRGLCELDTSVLRGMTFCPEHFEAAEYYLDTWADMQGEEER